jgi:hypothetical protein
MPALTNAFTWICPNTEECASIAAQAIRELLADDVDVEVDHLIHVLREVVHMPDPSEETRTLIAGVPR